MKKNDENIINGFKAKEIISEFDKDNLFLANKIISSRKSEDRKMIIGMQKDLVYRLQDNAYLTLSDLNNLNKNFILKRNINSLFSEEDNERYIETNGIMTFAGTINLDKDQEDFIYLDCIQNLLEYGINPHITSYDKIISELKKINHFLRKYYRINLHDASVNQDIVKDGYIRANINDYIEMINALNMNKYGDNLSNIYSKRK